MTQSERMAARLLYDPADPEILAEQSRFQSALWEFTVLRPESLRRSGAI